MTEKDLSYGEDPHAKRTIRRWTDGRRSITLTRTVHRSADVPCSTSVDDAGRVEGLAKGDGMTGYAYQALREAIYGPHADRLLLVRYESLTANPLGTLASIYNFLDEPLFAHTPDHIEPAYDMIEFDMRLGTPGLHHVRSAVRVENRPRVLPLRDATMHRCRRALERYRKMPYQTEHAGPPRADRRQAAAHPD